MAEQSSIAVGLMGADSSGPASLAQVIAEVEQQAASGGAERLRPLATGFSPLDEVLNGGIKPGELVVLGGPFGVGKTIMGLQIARNAVVRDSDARALYVCYEHDRAHLFSRLLCLESAEQGYSDEALTLRRLADWSLDPKGGGVIARLRSMPSQAAVLRTMSAYSERLILAKASGTYSTLEQIGAWVQAANSAGRLLLVVDYLQKIPLAHDLIEPETEATTFLTQGLKELAMSAGIQVLAIAAADREGLKTKRMRLSDLRGSSALQYEADVGLVLNNKFAIVSREHMVYNLSQAEAMRNWVVLTVEKNRAGRTAVDMEYALDAVHFRMVSTGDFVRERLVDERVILA